MADSFENKMLATQHSLEKNLRVLRLLHEIDKIAASPDIKISEKLEKIVSLLPSASLQPDKVCARITYNEQEFKTANYRDTGSIISADIIIQGKKIGNVEIGYTVKSPVPVSTQTSEVETQIFVAVTERTGSIIESSQVQQALMESEEKFSKAFHLSPAVIAITSLEDGRMIDVNDNFTRFTGYTREEALNLPPMDADGRNKANENESFIEHVKKIGSVRNIEAVFEIKNGGKRTVLLSADSIVFSGKPCILTVTQDITELKHNREFLESISAASPLGIYIMQDGVIKYASRQFQAITSYNRKEIPGGDLLNIIPESDKDVVRACTLQTLRGDKAYPCEYRILQKNGEVRWVMQTVAPIHYENREAILGSLMDITERKYLERKVTEYEELDKMKGDILAAVSHELRTPLAAIKGYATMMLDHHTRISADESMEDLIAINNSADALIKLVNNLLDTSRLDSGMLTLKRTLCSVSTLIKSVVKTASIRISTHQIKLKLPSSLPQVSIDKKRIRQVLENLIMNAARNSPRDTEILVSAVKKELFVEVSITDQGSAIPVNELNSVFDRMYKTEKRQNAGPEGMGLDLHICQRLIEAHGGRILAENEPVKGTTIRFTLPLIPPKKRRK